MAYSRGTEAYDYNRTNANRTNASRMYANSSAAPKRRPSPGTPPAPRPRVVKKTRAQLRAESKRSTAKAIKIMCICSLLFAIVAFQIYEQVRVDELDRELKSVNSDIAVLDSENTRLNMQLDAIISLDKVDRYAQDTLGMVKVENYQISYVDISGGDKVEVSGGKVHRSILDIIKSYFS